MYVLTERFWNKVEITKNCWIWKAGTNTDGYGNFKINGKNKKAHRLSFEYLKGKIPQGLQLDHLCRNRACVNPDHLEVVTQTENMLRGEGFYAINARKTHCPQGHPLKEPNLVELELKRGWRRCRTCANKYSNDRYHHKKN